MQVATIIAILLGCLILLWAAARAARLRVYLAGPNYDRAWKIGSVFVGLFIGGYLASAALVWADVGSALLPMVGAIFFFGALFVYLVVYAASGLVAEVISSNERGVKTRERMTAASTHSEATGTEVPKASADTMTSPNAGPNARSSDKLPDNQSDPASGSPSDGSELPKHQTSPSIVAARASERKMRKFIDPDGTAPTQFPPTRRDSHVRRYSGTFRMGMPSGDQVDTTPAPATILVVDDSHINRSILDSYLERLGHRGILIGDGTSALSVLETNNSIELVLLDYWLPDMEGLEILQRMKATDLHKDTPVLMLSSEDDSETIAQCIEAGADDFLSKPFAPRLLQARIDACLNKSRFRARELQFMARLESERKRSEELLGVILPTPIVKELSETNRVKPRRYEDVAVMFADISGFTAYCDKQQPEDVLSHLQSIVIAFEQLAEQYNVQKIKTIGDSFMAASGLLREVDDPVLHCVEMGFAMIKVVERAVPEWNLRIGIHIGPVVAGIVGRSQFLFDIWGDTVNTASRIESMASENGICVSARAWDEIKEQVIGQSLGLMHAKGKGDLELFRVDRLRAGASVGVADEDDHKLGSYAVH